MWVRVQEKNIFFLDIVPIHSEIRRPVIKEEKEKYMPTYKNISNNVQVVYNINFKPLEEKEVDFYIYDNANFKKTDDNPIYSPVAYSQKLSSNESLLIEDHIEEISEANQIRIAGKEPSLISFNDSPYKILVSDHSETIKPIYLINKITCDEGEVNVEFWRPAKWRN